MLSAEGLRVRYGSLEILRGVDFELGAGRIVGVLGPSGAGKSTLFRVLAGELEPSAGRVLLGERDITGAPLWVRARLGIGYVPQTPSVLWDLTVAENIQTFAGIAGQSGSPRGHAEEFELGHLLGVRARALSGGERRRLELVRALLANPKILILDEPLSGLDPASASGLIRALRARAEGGMAIVLADHRVRETLTLCHEALLLADGQVELRAAAEEFWGHPAVVHRYLE
ncbi:MAG TPA: ATP-binding cassette domain-containing protein [Polyangiaceae bacterium]|nr:ATP-binding cassette domain-containing protein [Polyangiaceae bacterium]